jgi:RHS repeat-associated protein
MESIDSVSCAYDAAGNMTSGAGTYQYDGENRLTSYYQGAGLYSYDGDGKRIEKQESSGTTIYVYNAAGQLIAEYTDPEQPVQGGGGLSYLTVDHLGSTRVVTDWQGNVKSRRDYLPFGEELQAGIGGRTSGQKYSQLDGVKQRFTGYERGSESGLDYAQARYYSSRTGRFTGVDPENAGASLGEPQSWNGYSYAMNNPLNYVDRFGLDSRYFIGDKEVSLTEYIDYVRKGNWQSLTIIVNGNTVAHINRQDYQTTTETTDASGMTRTNVEFNSTAYEAAVNKTIDTLLYFAIQNISPKGGSGEGGDTLEGGGAIDTWGGKWNEPLTEQIS